MGYKTLSIAQKEELLLYELSKSVEYFMSYIDETINKYQLLNKPDSAYTKVHLKIRETIAELHFRQSENIIFEKFYPLSYVKQEFATDFIANLSSIVKSIKPDAICWGIQYDICFFKSDGTPNGAITDFHINPSAFKAEFLKLKGWEQYIA